MSEAITQTDWQMFDRMGGFSDDLAANPPGPGQGTGAGLVATGDYYRSVHVFYPNNFNHQICRLDLQIPFYG